MDSFLPEVTIPIAILLIVYALFVAFFLLYSVFNVYHLLRFGVAGIGSYTVVGIFLAGSVGLLALSVLALSRYDWSVPLSVTAIFQGPEAASDLFEL